MINIILNCYRALLSGYVQLVFLKVIENFISPLSPPHSKSVFLLLPLCGNTTKNNTRKHLDNKTFAMINKDKLNILIFTFVC